MAGVRHREVVGTAHCGKPERRLTLNAKPKPWRAWVGKTKGVGGLMETLSRCGLARELDLLAHEQRELGKQRPNLSAGYFQAAWALSQAARKHWAACERCQAEERAESHSEAA